MGVDIQAQPARRCRTVTLDEAGRARVRTAVWRGTALDDPEEARLAVARAGRIRVLLAVVPPLLVVPVFAIVAAPAVADGDRLSTVLRDTALWRDAITATLMIWVLLLVTFGRWAALAQQRNRPRDDQG